MVRKKYRFTFFDTFVDVFELTVEQYLRLFIAGDKKILKEIFGKKIFEMNERQIKNALEILISGEQKKSHFNPPGGGSGGVKNKRRDDVITFEDFFILEGRIMHYLNQQRSEIRSWGLSYFYKVLENLDVIIGEKTFDDYKNAEKPDKKGIKESLNTSS